MLGLIHRFSMLLMGKLWYILSICVACSLLSATPLLGQPLDTLWTRRIGGDGNYRVFDATFNPFGDIVFVGSYASSQVADPHILIGKVSAEGDCTWTRILDTLIFQPKAILSEPDGSFTLGGGCPDSSVSGICRLSATGDLLWRRPLPPGGYVDEAAAMCRTPDGGYVLCGYCSVSIFVLGKELYMVKTDSVGNVLWAMGCRPAEMTRTEGTRVIPVRSGGYAALGFTQQLETPFDTYIYLVRVNEQGDTLWTRTYDDGSVYCEGAALAETADGGYLLADWSHLVRTDSLGSVLWQRDYTGSPSLQTFTLDIVPSVSNGWVLAGGIESISGPQEFLLMGISAIGDSLWARSYPTEGIGGAVSRVLRMNDGGLVMIGETGCMPFCSILIVRTAAESAVGHLPILPRAYALLDAFPNPFNASTNIRFSLPQTERATLVVYDIRGRQVQTLADALLTAGAYQATFDGSQVTSGVYFCRLTTPFGSQTKKLLLVK